LAGSVLVGAGLWLLLPRGFAANVAADPLLVISTLLLYPVVEEFLFRGVIQGWLLERPSLATRNFGISRANLITSILFVGLHLFNHSPAWALAVLIPSLTFGHFRDRYHGLAIPMLLHIFFNAIYLVAGSL
jgi:CAAX protease family protein